MFKKKALKEIVWQKKKNPQLLVTTEVAESEGNISVFQSKPCLGPQAGEAQLVTAEPR